MPQKGWRRYYRRLGVLLIVVSCALIAQAAFAYLDTKTEFDIPAGELAKTILEFRRQSGVFVWYTSVGGSVQGVLTNAVSGTLTPAEALSRMLKGTGCTWKWEGEKSIIVLLNSADAHDDGGAAGVDEMHARGMDDPSVMLELKDLQQVLVTGTYLRGVEETIAPTLRVQKQDFARTGFATAEAALDALPLNFIGGAREDFANTLSSNFNHGQAPNLRGLGTGATLVLVNGLRQPASGLDGDFIDISTVPISAIERIDVMPDGASALYGSDAIAGVVNVITRQDVDGAQTQARLAAVQGGGNELLLAQLATHRWGTGKALFSYQFLGRQALPLSARPYAANADKGAYGGDDFRTLQDNPGNILDPLTFRFAYALPSNGTATTVADLRSTEPNLRSRFATSDLLPERKTHSLYATVTQELTPRLEAFADVRFNRRDEQQMLFARSQVLRVPPSNPYYIDPFGSGNPVLVAYSFEDDLGVLNSEGHTQTYFTSFGIRSELPREWRAALSGSYGSESLRWKGFNLLDPAKLTTALLDSHPETAFNPFGAGSHTSSITLNEMRRTQAEHSISTIGSVDLIADGPVMRLPAGVAKLAMGVGARHGGLQKDVNVTVLTRRQYARDDAYAFAEMSVPLVPRLELSLAGRFDRYSDFGGTLNRKLGLTWSPDRLLKFRASFGTSFKAPLLVDLDEADNGARFGRIPDPRSPTGTSVVLALDGNNALLREETAKTWTAGLDFGLPFLSGFTASVTYFDIDYRNQILKPGFSVSPTTILFEEDRWRDVITRNPSRTQILEACDAPIFVGSRADCLTTTPAAIIDFRRRNLASTRVNGVDLSLERASSSTRLGVIHWSLDGTYLRTFEQRVTPSSAGTSIRDTTGNPISSRMRATLDWHEHGEQLPGFGASFTAHYARSYIDTQSVPIRRIDPAKTFDVQLTYRTPPNIGWREDMEVVLGAVNLLDADPPFLNSEIGYDVANAEATGRLLTLSLQKTW